MQQDQRSMDQHVRTSRVLVNFGKLFAAGLGPFAQTGGFAVRQVARQAPPVSFPIQQASCACMHPLAGNSGQLVGANPSHL